MSTSIHPTPQPDHPHGPRPAFWVGAAGFIAMALLGLTSGIAGVLVFGGLYLAATAIFHALVGRSWVSSVYPASRGKALIGVPAGLVLLITGGLTAPHHPQHSLATVTPTSPATSAAPTPTSTPTPVATPSHTTPLPSSSSTIPAATHSATSSPPPSTTTPAATHSATSSPPPSTSAHPTARISPALVPLAKPTRTRTSSAPQQPPRPTTSKPTTHRTAPQPPDTDIVHPGAFCSPEGDTGVSAKGKSMICTEASDGRLRWKRG